MNVNPKGNPNPRTEFLDPAGMGNQRARKHSDLQIAEVIALREKYKIGYGQISYLTGIPKSTVEKYIKGERTQNLMSSNEFNQKVQEIQSMMSKHAPASRKGVQESKAEMRARLRKERQDRLADEAIPHTPVPTQKQVQAEAQRIAALRNGMQKQVQQPARDRDAWNQEWMDNLKRAGVPRGAPKHVVQRYRPEWRPER
jgi:predicted transcriptional regulator